MPATVTGLNILSGIASRLPKLNPPRPVYAIVDSETFEPLTVPDSWGEFAPRTESQVSDYPVESGAFATYNKVRRPTGVTVTLVKTGSDVARLTWLAAITQSEAQQPTRLFTLISPQAVYVDYTLVGLSYETRQDRGSNMLYLTLQFTQVQQIASSDDSKANVKEPKSSIVDRIGQVYTNAANSVQTALIDAKNFILQ
jgi:hypothetical protein